MADWSEISNAETAVGEPTRSSTARKLRDNPIAISEGRLGAPRMSPWAFNGPVVTAGTSLRHNDPGRVYVMRDFTPGVNMATHKVTVFCRGVLRFSYRTLRPVGTGTLTTRLIRVRGGATSNAGSEYTHSSGSGSGTLTRTQDITGVEPGDAYYVQARFSPGDTNGSYAGVDDFTISTGGAYIWALGGGALVLATEPA